MKGYYTGRRAHCKRYSSGSYPSPKNYSMKPLFTIVFTFFLNSSLPAQDSTVALPKKVSITGYVKNLETLTFDKNFKEIILGNFIHNRLNIKWKPSAKITTAAEFRNRLFWGEEVRMNPGFASMLKNGNEKVNLQKAWIQHKSLVLHTNVERLYFDYNNEEVNVRIGRQRINWGITTTWNPNDIFNTYNFLDFDYEERPGADGGKFNYRITNNFNVELAYAHNGKNQDNIAAFKYALNKWDYDIQLITGWYNDHLTLGAGWAGSIKEAGFKGEVQYFSEKKDSVDHLNLTLEVDYMFKNTWYVNAGILFNGNGVSQPVKNWNEVSFNPSPENLMPTKWNIIIKTAKEFTPLFTGNISVLYAPGTDLLILFPSLAYNIAANFDVNLVWQSFFARLNNNFEAINHRCFLRMKWSF
jgi:hypothetical protein